MADAFTVLRRDHERVERMLTELEEGPNAAGGADQAQLIARRRLMQQLVADQSGHEAAEEQCLWPVVRERLPGGDVLADEAMGQEQGAKRALGQLDQLEAWDQGFEPLLRAFIAATREHVTFEETKVWPGLRQALSSEETDDLGDKLLKARPAA